MQTVRSRSLVPIHPSCRRRRRPIKQSTMVVSAMLFASVGPCSPGWAGERKAKMEEMKGDTKAKVEELKGEATAAVEEAKGYRV